MTAPCIHHWLIETPKGPECRGVCRKCGAVRMYSTTASELRMNPPSPDYGHTGKAPK